MIAHAKSPSPFAGALTPLFPTPLPLLFRASRGVPRVAANLLRSALFLADERGQNDLDETILLAAIERPAHQARNEQFCHPDDPFLYAIRTNLAK